MKIRVGLCLVASCFLAGAALAKPSSARTAVIKQVFKDRGRAVVEISGGADAGAEFVASDSDGRQCVVRVIQSQEDMVTVDTRNCRNQELRAGQKLERSLLSADAASASPVSRRGSARYPADTSSMAESYTPGLMDYGYMPNAQQWVVNGGIEGANTKITTDFKGRNINEAKIEVQNFYTQLMYGLREDWAVGVELKTSMTDTTKIKYGPASSNGDGTVENSKENGFYDPVIGVQYRFLKQGEAIANSFLRFELSPGIIDAVAGAQTTEGTQGRGGPSALLAFKMTRDTSQYSARAQLGYTFASSRTVRTGGTSTDLTYDGGSSLVLDAEAMYKFNDSLGLLGGLGYGRFDEISVSQSGNSTPVSYSAVTGTNLKVGGRYQMLPERLMLEATYSIISPMTRDYNVGSQTRNLKTSANMYVLNATYAF